MDDRLREIEERVAKASPGPWEVEGVGGIHMDGTRDWYAVRVGNHVIRGLEGKAEADFIAHARWDITWLLQQLREASEENARLREVLVRIERHSNSHMGWALGKSEEWFDALVKPGRIARAALEEQP